MTIQRRFGLGWLRLALCACLAAAWLLWSAVPGMASTYTVANTDTSGTGSLAAVVTAANNDPSPPTIINFKPGLTGTISLTGTLTISGSMSIDGPGADVLDVDGDGNQIVSVPSSSTTVAISGLEFSAGHATTYGGAIDNAGTLNISDAQFAYNSAGSHDDSTTNAGSGDGGAIDNTGTLTLTNSTFTNNSAGGAGGSADYTDQGYGGAIYDTGSLSVTGSTFADNSAGTLISGLWRTTAAPLRRRRWAQEARRLTP